MLRTVPTQNITASGCHAMSSWRPFETIAACARQLAEALSGKAGSSAKAQPGVHTSRMQLQVLPKASRKLDSCLGFSNTSAEPATQQHHDGLQADLYDMRRGWHLSAEESQAVMMPYQPTCCTCSAELTASLTLEPLLSSFRWLEAMCMRHWCISVWHASSFSMCRCVT